MEEQHRDGSRRDFLKVAAGVAAGAAMVRLSPALRGQAPAPPLGARKPLPCPFVKDGRHPLVVVEGTNCEAMLAAGVDAIGGLEGLVKGRRVVLKPNLCSAQPFPVTTDPDLVFALVGALRKAGCTAVSIVESPTAGGSRKDQPFAANGFFERGRAAGVQVSAIDNQSASDFVAVREARWQVATQLVNVSRQLLDAPVIINLPTLKRHFIPGMTCALKNFFGSVQQTDRRRAHGEARNGEAGVANFKKLVAEYADVLRCELTIVDARSLVIKGGPSLGSGPAEVKAGVNRLIVGSDIVAVEAFSANLLARHDDAFSAAMADGSLEHCERLGMGRGDLKQARILEVRA